MLLLILVQFLNINRPNKRLLPKLLRTRVVSTNPFCINLSHRTNCFLCKSEIRICCRESRFTYLFLTFILIRIDIFVELNTYSHRGRRCEDGVGKQEAPPRADKRKLRIKCLNLLLHLLEN